MNPDPTTTPAFGLIGWGLFVLVGLLMPAFLYWMKSREVPKPGPSPVQQAEDRKAEEAISEVRQKAVVDVQKAEQEHELVIDRTVEAQTARVEALGDDAKATNEFLKGVGKSVR